MPVIASTSGHVRSNLRAPVWHVPGARRPLAEALIVGALGIGVACGDIARSEGHDLPRLEKTYRAAAVSTACEGLEI